MTDMAQNVKKIVIVGGGTAGWMTAAFLSKLYQTDKSNLVSIDLIESKDQPALGVGEATIQSFRFFLQTLGISEGEFLLHTNATLKHGILFKNWNDPTSTTDQYFHPFESAAPLSAEPQINHWLNVKTHSGNAERYDRWHSVQPLLAAANKSPKSLTDPDYMGSVPYGYHLDACKLADFLANFAIKNGVKRHFGNVTTIKKASADRIESVSTETNEYAADIFFDCSGFKSLLINSLGASFKSLSHLLPCDKAVSHRLVVDQETYLPKPYTTANARKAGWTFDIDLFDRKGLGYVYSSKHISDDEAEAEFRSAFNLGKELSVNHFQTRVGRQESAWIGNCICIGLSQGFIEPLESTGLYFIETSLRYLVDLIDINSDLAAAAKKFNQLINETFDQAVDFIIMHYRLTQRKDTSFWLDASHSRFLSDQFAETFSQWKLRPPAGIDFAGKAFIFSESSYSCILYGMGYDTKLPFRMMGYSLQDSLKVKKDLENIQKSILSNSIPHIDLVTKLRSAFVY